MSSSLNALAEARQLAPWTSWSNGTPAGYFRGPLDEAAVNFYHENGFLVVEDALSRAELDEVLSETTEICRGARGQIGGLPTVTPAMTDEDVLRQVLCIHFPHKLSEVMKSKLGHPTIVDVLTKCISPNVKCMQSMLFVKSSGKPGQAWHQDEVYIPTRDRSLTGGWIALDDATVENGCLWVIPGSHKRGIMYFQEWHGDPRFDCALEARRFPWSNDDAVPVEVKAGSIVFFNGYLLHRSLPNYASGGYRRSLVNHYMSAESLLPWGTEKSDDYIAIQDSRDVIMIAGEDPYAWRGYTNVHGTHVRPDGKGGCGNNEYNVSR